MKKSALKIRIALTYNAFTTIIRQVCKFNSIKSVPRVRYIESLYMNEYAVFTT